MEENITQRHIIYKIISPTGKIYVGKTSNYKKRVKSYQRLSCQSQPMIYNSIKRHGFENHIFEIIEECNTDISSEREIFWIEKLNSYRNGLNLTAGGSSGGDNSRNKDIKQSKPFVLRFYNDALFYKIEQIAISENKSVNLKINELLEKSLKTKSND